MNNDRSGSVNENPVPSRPKTLRRPAPGGCLLLASACLLLCAAPAPAAIRVEISGVEDELEENVRARLDLVRFAGRKDLSEAAVRRLFRRAPEEAAEALRPFGYYAPRISPELERDGEDWVASIAIEPGRPVVLAELDVRVTGAGEGNAAFERVVSGSPMKPGRRLNHAEYDNLRDSLQREAQTLGYFDAGFEARRLEVDPERHEARAILHLESGPRYDFGPVRIEQTVLRKDMVGRLVPMREGEPYDARQVLKTQYSLTDSLYYSTVIVEPGQPDPETRTVPVLVTTTPVNAQRVRLGIGYATDTRLRGSIGWEFRRLNRSGHTAGLETRLSEPKSEFTARYRIPLGNPLEEHLQFNAGFFDETLGDTTSRRMTVGVAHRKTLGNWTRTLFADVIREQSDIPSEPTFEDTLVVPGIAMEKLVADDILYPTQGYRLSSDLRGSHPAIGSTSRFVRAHFVANRVLSRGEAWRFSLRSELGVGLVEGFDELPASQRFFAGGDQSVRGYGYQELGPQDANGSYIGGRHLLFGSVEAERRIRGRFSLAAFVDGGGAVDEFQDTELLQVSVGAGLHVRTPVGTLRFEVARAVTESRALRLHLTIRPDL